MKYLWLLPLFLLSSCSSVRYVTVDREEHLVTQDHKQVSIWGNPYLICHYGTSVTTYSGFFMYQKDNGVIVLDDFGRGNIELSGNPICKLDYAE